MWWEIKLDIFAQLLAQTRRRRNGQGKFHDRVSSYVKRPRKLYTRSLKLTPSRESVSISDRQKPTCWLDEDETISRFYACSKAKEKKRQEIVRSWSSITARDFIRIMKMFLWWTNKINLHKVFFAAWYLIQSIRYHTENSSDTNLREAALIKPARKRLSFQSYLTTELYLPFAFIKEKEDFVCLLG